MADLLGTAVTAEEAGDEPIAPGAMLLRGMAQPFIPDIVAALGEIAPRAPFRHMTTPWGAAMSAAMTNCGDVGWLSDRGGYRYDRIDPQTGQPWPAMPACFRALATLAASRAGYPDFVPDACLLNRYAPGAKLSAHQDRDERDYTQPIVSVSLGLPATFLFGGPKRRAPMQKLLLRHGDVAVWGGPSRLAYHGVAELQGGEHAVFGAQRVNLTLRRAL